MKITKKILQLFEKAGYETYCYATTVMDLNISRDPKTRYIVTTASSSEAYEILDGLFVDVNIETSPSLGYMVIKLSDNSKVVVKCVNHINDYIDECYLSLDTLLMDAKGNIIRMDETDNDVFNVLHLYNDDMNLPADIILRAIYYCIRYDLEMDRVLCMTIRESVDKELPGDMTRIRGELNRIITSKNPCSCFRLMAKCKVLDWIFPGLNATIGYKLNSSNHHRALFDHLMNVITHTEAKLEIRYAALLHDISKPVVRMDVDGRSIYPEHSEKSAKMAEFILKRLGYNEYMVRKVYLLIYYHSSRYDLENGNLNVSKMAKTLTGCTGDKRLLQDVINLQIADVVSSKPPYRLDSIFKLKHELSRFEMRGENKHGKDIHSKRYNRYRNKDSSFRSRQDNK